MRFLHRGRVVVVGTGSLYRAFEQKLAPKKQSQTILKNSVFCCSSKRAQHKMPGWMQEEGTLQYAFMQVTARENRPSYLYSMYVYALYVFSSLPVHTNGSSI